MLEASLERETQKVYTHLKPWDRVQLARLQERPTSLDYIPHIFDSFIELHGDRNFRDDPAMIGGIGYLNGQAVTVVGQQRGKDTKDNIYRNFGMAHPEGYRKALRLMKQAENLIDLFLHLSIQKELIQGKQQKNVVKVNLLLKPYRNGST